MKRALALLPVLISVGCTGSAPPAGIDLDTLALSDAAPQDAPRHGESSPPSVQLPPGKATVAGVSSGWRANGFSERIRLATDTPRPESHIDLAIRTGGADGKGVAPAPASDAAIGAELTHEFPGLLMQTAPPGAYRNAYGEYGLAIGRRGPALRCIYVWQYIEDARVSFASGGRVASQNLEPAPASLRMKLCRSDMTVDDLASAASSLEITLPDDFGSGPRPGVAACAPARVARGDAAASEPRRVYAPSYAAPVEPQSYPAPAYSSGYMAPVTAAAPEGQRFLAPPAGAPPVVGVAPSRGAAQPVGVAATDLPPQAFAGPTDPTPR